MIVCGKLEPNFGAYIFQRCFIAKKQFPFLERMASLLRTTFRSSLLRAPLLAKPDLCRQFQASRLLLEAQPPDAPKEEFIDAHEAEDTLNYDFDDDDTTSGGHLMLRQQRQTLYYLRLIEHEMPKLVGTREIASVFF